MQTLYQGIRIFEIYLLHSYALYHIWLFPWERPLYTFIVQSISVKFKAVMYSRHHINTSQLAINFPVRYFVYPYPHAVPMYLS